jgi:hypothetical protein
MSPTRAVVRGVSGGRPRCPRSSALILALLIVLLAGRATVGAADLQSIEADGTAFKVTLSDGKVLRSRDLVGAQLVLALGGQRMRVRIDAVEPDPDDQSGDVLLHTFSTQATDGAWTPLCDPGPDGRRQGFPVAGVSRPDGALVAGGPGMLEIVCSSGGRGKCVRFGYHPWKTAPDGRPMLDNFNACVRMLRADYCGDGRGWTRDGTLVDVWDDLAIQRLEGAGDPAFAFEAAWGPQGAVCVAHTRIPENIALDQLKAYCPRLARMPACDESVGRAAGALLFNRSRP